MKSEEKFSLQSLALNTAAQSLIEVLRDLWDPRIEVKKIQELEEEMEDGKSENGSFTGGVNLYEEFLKRGEAMIEGEEQKSLSQLTEFRKIEQ